jgi:hypothetical protein
MGERKSEFSEVPGLLSPGVLEECEKIINAQYAHGVGDWLSGPVQC